MYRTVFKPGQSPNPTMNAGAVDRPLFNNGLIQDNSDRALNLASKLTDPVF